jgi:single-strand DNA-binding protein
MSGVARAIVVGNLTRDPELRHTGGGTPVCELSVAVNSREKVNGEWQDRADFFEVTVWGNQAEACGQYLAKGRAVAVDGRLRQERWESQEGDKRSKVKIVADNVQFLGSGEGRSEEGSFGSDKADDDIPF